MLARLVVDGLVIARHEVSGRTLDNCASEDYGHGVGCAEGVIDSFALFE